MARHLSKVLEWYLVWWIIFRRCCTAGLRGPSPELLLGSLATGMDRNHSWQRDTVCQRVLESRRESVRVVLYILHCIADSKFLPVCSKDERIWRKCKTEKRRSDGNWRNRNTRMIERRRLNHFETVVSCLHDRLAHVGGYWGRRRMLESGEITNSSLLL